MNKRNCVWMGLIGCALLVAGPVSADEGTNGAARPEKGFYGALSGGWQQRSTTYELDGAQYTSWDSDYVINAAAGYRFCPFYRMDLEGTFLESDADRNKAAVPGAVEADADGDVTLKAATLNGYLEYPIQGTRITPYVGAGIGLWQAELNGLTSPELERLGMAYWGTPLVLSDESAIKSDWQIRGGLSYALTARWDLFAEYRYFHGQRYYLNFPDYGISVAVPAPEFSMIQAGLAYRF